MIVRIRRRENPFVQIDKRPLEDARLSWRAKGILAYLLSKPDGWNVRTEDILKHGSEGRDAVRSAMGELREHGYATLQQTAKGREWIVYEEPQKPSPENPSVVPSPEKPSPEKANVGKSDTSNKDLFGRENEERETTQGAEMDKKFREEWNSLPSPFPKIRVFSSSKQKTLRARMRETEWRGHYQEALTKLRDCNFAKGKNDRRWIMDAEFFLRPDSVAKILEGKYDDSPGDGKTAGAVPFWKKHV